jgi:hypothetical protein
VQTVGFRVVRVNKGLTDLLTCLARWGVIVTGKATRPEDVRGQRPAGDRGRSEGRVSAPQPLRAGLGGVPETRRSQLDPLLPIARASGVGVSRGNLGSQSKVVGLALWPDRHPLGVYRDTRRPGQPFPGSDFTVGAAKAVGRRRYDYILLPASLRQSRVSTSTRGFKAV